MQVLTGFGIGLGVSLFFLFLGFGIGYQFYKLKVVRSFNTAAKLIEEKIAASKESTSRPVPEFAQIIDGVRYNTMDAKCIAQGASLIGWTWLMQTNSNRFFFVSHTMFGNYMISVLSKSEAVQAFTNCIQKEVKFEDAFPDVEIKDA